MHNRGYNSIRDRTDRCLRHGPFDSSRNQARGGVIANRHDSRRDQADSSRNGSRGLQADDRGRVDESADIDCGSGCTRRCGIVRLSGSLDQSRGSDRVCGAIHVAVERARVHTDRQRDACIALLASDDTTFLIYGTRNEFIPDVQARKGCAVDRKVAAHAVRPTRRARLVLAIVLGANVSMGSRYTRSTGGDGRCWSGRRVGVCSAGIDCTAAWSPDAASTCILRDGQEFGGNQSRCEGECETQHDLTSVYDETRTGDAVEPSSNE